MHIRIRRARLSDLDLLVRYRRLMWEQLGVADTQLLDENDRVYKRRARTRLRNRTLLAWLAIARNKAVAGIGCLWLQPLLPRPGNNRMIQPYVFSMYTDPSYRSKGVATRILREVIEWSKKNGFLSVGLHAGEIGRSLYRNLGFRRTWEMRVRFMPEGNLTANGTLLRYRKR